MKQIYCVIHKNNTPNNPVNAFYHPLGTGVPTLTGDNLEFQCTLGSKKIPQQAVTGSAEAYMRLRQAAGQFFTGDGSMSGASRGSNFTNDRAIFALDFEKTGNMALMTGENTKSSTLTLEFRNVTGIAAGDYLECFQVCDIIASLRQGSCDVLD